jgi:phage shock protein PspC (stress-responsive transcriptional regulator)
MNTEDSGRDERQRKPDGEREPQREREPEQEQKQKQEPQDEQEPRRPRRLLRSRENRVIGGVCGGLGRYFDVDPIFFRIGAIALALAGGAGIVLYLAAILLVPSDGSEAVGQPAFEGRNRGLVIAGVAVLLLVAWPFLVGGGLLVAGILVPLAVLVATGVLVWWLVSGEGPAGEGKDVARRAALGIGVLILCLLIACGGAWAAAAGGGTVVAVLVIGAGIAIIAGAFLRPVRWLILPAVTLAISAGAVAAAGIDLDGGVGERDYRPASVSDLRDTYKLGMGQLTVDLRQVDLPAGDTPLTLDLGVGEARLVVPDDVCVATDAQVGMGEVRVFDRHNDGVDVDVLEQPDALPDTSRLLVDADIGVGALHVGHDFAELDYHGARFDNNPDDVLGSDNSACSGARARK